MTTPPLKIRNLTIHPLELKFIEYYEALKEQLKQSSSGKDKYTGSFTTTAHTPSALQLVKHAQTFNSQDVSIKIDPFTIVETSVKLAERHSKDVVRLTFDQCGERHRINLPPSSNASQAFVPLTHNSRLQFTGVFIPQDMLLAIYSPASLDSWMKELHDATPLSGLSIPGTHNSHTYYRALPSVRCQSVALLDQLENGIRFLDIRLQPERPHDSSHDGLLLVHGLFPVSLTGPKYFRPLLTTLLAFLESHPSESIVLSLKREGSGSATDHQFHRILHDHYIQQDPIRWYTAPMIPSLGAVRGKLVLLRRFELNPSTPSSPQPPHSSSSSSSFSSSHDVTNHRSSLNPNPDRISSSSPSTTHFGLNASHWPSNTPHHTTPVISVQDYCDITHPTRHLPLKIQHIRAHLARAAARIVPIPGVTTDAQNPVPSGPLYLNFATGSSLWRRGSWPERVAERVNPEVVRWLCRGHGSGDWGTGVVVLDWVGIGGDWDVVRCIVGMNARLMFRERALRR
ncbi:PLC-like phosphodiesterase [Viridothelium virens]|uniref:PLC-like phosphodiesterase n=1 Tax=Viridothelium virens TaxID=1048519 RepID=A0A6A6HJ85_VIRVR|nr:PLC-like phosphodiesterase [Viridothelium virens]